MAREQLTLEKLKLLDFGKVQEAFLNEQERVVKDCMDRPIDDKARTVTIQFKYVPEADTSGTQADCSQVLVACEVTSVIPKRRTRVYSMLPRHNGSLMFEPNDPLDPEQERLFEEHERGHQDKDTE